MPATVDAPRGEVLGSAGKQAFRRIAIGLAGRRPPCFVSNHGHPASLSDACGTDGPARCAHLEGSGWQLPAAPLGAQEDLRPGSWGASARTTSKALRTCSRTRSTGSCRGRVPYDLAVPPYHSSIHPQRKAAGSTVRPHPRRGLILHSSGWS